MTEAQGEQRGGSAAGPAGNFRLSPAAGGATDLAATGADAEALLLAGLDGVLALVRGNAPATPAEAATAAVPIRGQGAGIAPLFAEIAADLLAQLDANGPGLDRVRLDGLLQTDDGGATAWGYLLGAAADAPPPIDLALDSDPVVEQTAAGWTLRCRLARVSATA